MITTVKHVLYFLGWTSLVGSGLAGGAYVALNLSASDRAAMHIDIGILIGVVALGLAAIIDLLQKAAMSK